MRHFDLIILVNRPQADVYNYLSDPHNLPGLQPLLTSVKIQDRTQTEEGAVVIPFYLFAVIRFLGIPVFRRRVQVISTLTRPPEEMQRDVQVKPGILVHSLYELRREDGATQIKLRVNIVKVSQWLENIVYEQALQMQRALLINLKNRLEGTA